VRGHWIVRLPTWLGDTAMAVPTVRALGREVDDLTLWGPPAICRLLQATGIAHRWLPWRRKVGAAKTLVPLRAARLLAATDADGVLLLPNAFEPALSSRLAGIRRRVGYATDGRSWLLTDPVPVPDPVVPLHDADRYSRLLLAINVPAPHPEDVLLEIPRAVIDGIRRQLGSSAPLLGLVPGSANGPAKRWPASHFAQLADAAVARWGAQPVILGGPADNEIAASVQAAATTRCLNLVGRTDLEQLASVLQLCRAVVSNDTGPAHLAAALSTPTLVLFGPTDPQRTRPRGPRVRIAGIRAFCQPCMLATCPLDRRCMTGVLPDLVMSALEPLWVDPSHSAPS